MPPSPDGAREIDAYVDDVPQPFRAAVQSLRAQLLKGVPEPAEGFSYGVPAVFYRDTAVACYAASKKHLSLFPMGGALIEKYAEELADYSTSSGTIRFTPEHPLPKRLVTKIVRDRLAMIDEKLSRPRRRG